ncbi:MAG: excisionase, partial [Eubacterium sp.]|nr:excisionase [Eubacterium sp.]
HGEQLRLVSDFKRFDFSSLDGIEDEIKEIMTAENSGNFIEESRAEVIADFVRKRIDHIQNIALAEDISEEYEMKIE